MNNELPAVRGKQSLQQARARASQLALQPFAPENETPAASSGLSMGLIVGSLKRWWKLASCCGLVLALVAVGLVWLRGLPIYRASAFLKVDGRPPYLAFGEPQHGVDHYIATQVEVMRSPLVMDRAITMPQLLDETWLFRMRAPAEWLAKKVVVEQLGLSEVLQVSFEYPDAAVAADVVNAVVSAYEAERASDAARRNAHVIALLEREMRRRAMELEAQRAEVNSLLVHFPELMTENGRSERAPGGELAPRLMNTEVEVEVLAAQLTAARDALQSSDSAIDSERLEKTLSEHPEIKRLTEVAEKRQLALGEALAIAARGSSEPVVLQLEKQSAAAQEQLRRRREALRQVAEAQLRRQVQQEQASSIVKLEADLKGRKVLLERLREQLHQPADVKNPQAMTLAEAKFAKAELDRADAIYQQISQRTEAMRTELHAPARVSVLRAASPPKQPLSDAPYLKCAGAGMVAFLLPFIGAIFLDLRTRRVDSAKQITEEANLSVVGEIARLPEPGRRRSRHWLTACQMFDESIDSVRTRLLLSDELKDFQVLAVTSAISGEGKTRVACHLAKSLARTGCGSTLIIDADLRNPEVHKIFEHSNDHGLADVLAGGAKVFESVLPVEANLDILPAGVLRASPYQLFKLEDWQRVLAELRANYRYIIVDVPPVLLATEALIVARAADQALLCAMRDMSRSPQIRMAYEQLVAAGAQPVGAVLNGVPIRAYQAHAAYYAGARV